MDGVHLHVHMQCTSLFRSWGMAGRIVQKLFFVVRHSLAIHFTKAMVGVFLHVPAQVRTSFAYFCNGRTHRAEIVCVAGLGVTNWSYQLRVLHKAWDGGSYILNKRANRFSMSRERSDALCAMQICVWLGSHILADIDYPIAFLTLALIGEGR